jgi:D-xylose transport system permease protein
MLCALVGVVAFIALAERLADGRVDFFTPRNLTLLSIELAVTTVLALGMLVVILPGHIDLGAGSGVGLFGGLAAMLVMRPDQLAHQLLGKTIAEALGIGSGHGLPAGLAMLLTTLVAVAVYTGLGMLIARQRIPAFIITLGGLLAFKGLHWRAIANSTVPVTPGGTANLYSELTTFYLPSWLGWTLVTFVIASLVVSEARARTRALARGRAFDGEAAVLRVLVVAQLLALWCLYGDLYRGLPLAAVVLVVVAAGMQLLTAHTPFGRYLYAIGSNEEAARMSGIRVERTVVGAYALMGMLVAATGFLQTAYAGASTTTIGQLMELDAVAACVIGGASLRGGRGTVVGVLFGSLIIVVLLNGMTLLAVTPENKYLIRGIVLACAVWLDVRLSRT